MRYTPSIDHTSPSAWRAGVILALLAFCMLALLSGRLEAQGAEKAKPVEAPAKERPVEKVEPAKDAAGKDAPAGDAVEAKKDAPAASEADGDEAKTEKKADAKTGTKADAEDSRDKRAEEKEQAEEKPKEPPVFRLRDGTRITGFPKLEQITIDTAYGQLRVPVADVVRVRFATEKDPNIANRVRALVEKLASEDFEKREEAMASLLEVGPEALPVLREALESDDEEVTSRAQTLIKKLEEAIEEEGDFGDDESGDETPIGGDDDELVTLKFTALGRIHERVFEVASNYGALKIDRGKIVSIVFQEHTPSQVELSVPGTFFAGANNWFQTKISLAKGESFKISAGNQIFLQNYGHNCDPDGSTQTSTKHFQTFRLGALVARIGKKGKPFLVGKKYKGKASAEGKLMFGVAVRSGTVTGAYAVKVELADK